MKPEISNEQLNAFVDNELDMLDKDSVFMQLETDAALKQAVCDLHAVKALVRHAYVAPPLAQSAVTRQFYLPKSLVAGVMLVLGLSAGWLGHGVNQSAPALRLAGTQLPPPIDTAALRPVSLAGVTQDMNRIVMHVDSADSAKFNTLLDDVDYLVQQHATQGQSAQIEVLASNNGLNMLRSDTTPYAARIAALIEHHPNVTFVACNQTLQRLQKEGVDVQLLPRVQIIPTATGEVVSRLHGGWTYIKV